MISSLRLAAISSAESGVSLNTDGPPAPDEEGLWASGEPQPCMRPDTAEDDGEDLDGEVADDVEEELDCCSRNSRSRLE